MPVDVGLVVTASRPAVHRLLGVVLVERADGVALGGGGPAVERDIGLVSRAVAVVARVLVVQGGHRADVGVHGVD